MTREDWLLLPTQGSVDISFGTLDGKVTVIPNFIWFTWGSTDTHLWWWGGRYMDKASIILRVSGQVEDAHGRVDLIVSALHLIWGISACLDLTGTVEEAKKSYEEAKQTFFQKNDLMIWLWAENAKRVCIISPSPSPVLEDLPQQQVPRAC